MPLEIRTNDAISGGAPGPLIGLIRTVYDDVRDVSIEVRRAKHYERTRMSVGIQRCETLQDAGVKLGPEAHDETAEEIALAVFELASEHSQVSGCTHYRAIATGTKGDGYGDIGTVLFTVGLDETGTPVGGSGAPDGTDMLELARKIAEDVHTKHMTTLDKTNELANGLVTMSAKLAETSGPLARAMVDIEQIRFSRFDRQCDADEQERRWAGGAEVIGKIAEPFSTRLAEVVAGIVSDKWGEGAAPADGAANGGQGPDDDGRSPRASKLEALVAKLTGAQISGLEKIVGEDQWAMISALRKSPTDHEYENIVKALNERAAADPGANKQLGQIVDLLGTTVALELSRLFKVTP